MDGQDANGDCRFYDNTMNKVWDKLNRGVCAPDSPPQRVDNRNANRDRQRQWKDIRSKYVEAAEED
jgi:hypothetical protein